MSNNDLSVASEGRSNVLPNEMRDLAQYDAMLMDISGISAMLGPFYMQGFLKAKDTASLYHSQAIRNYERCRDESKKLWAVAKLDKSFAALREKGIVKPTEGDRECYADCDEDYLKMREAEAYWKSLSILLGVKVDTYQAAHDDAKKIYDKTEEPRGSSKGLPSTKERYE